jgi:hypothetical protein
MALPTEIGFRYVSAPLGTVTNGDHEIGYEIGSKTSVGSRA